LPIISSLKFFFDDVDFVDPDPLFARVPRLVRVAG